MSLKDFLNLDAKLVGNSNCCPGQRLNIKFNFSNQCEKNIYFKNIVIYFESYCAINTFHLRRFHKKNEVEKIISNYSQRCVDCNKSTSGGNNDEFLLLKSELLIFQNLILCANDNVQSEIQIRIPDESLPSYKSKYIRYYSLVRIKTNLTNDESKEMCIPVNINNQILRTNNLLFDSDNEDFQTNNPFLLKETHLDDHPEADLINNSIQEKQTPTRYKITYKDSELCFLTMLKSQMFLGEDIRIIINFVGTSSIRCAKFSVTLKATEKLLIPDNSSTNQEITLSIKEFGPYYHDSLCIEIYPLVLQVPNDQYPSLNFDIFNLQWSLEFTFMIAKTADVTCDIDDINLAQSISWSFKKDIKTDLLKWELPILVYLPRMS